MEWKDIAVLVVGLKRSGMAAAELLAQAGARVSAMDSEAPGAEAAARLSELRIPFVPQGDAAVEVDAIVISPGVPADLPMLEEARRRGVQVIGEVELAADFLKGPVIGITGSNGKTTTTALTGHILQACGIPAQMGGNIGTAVTALIKSSRDGQWNVLELSSFQLETISHFRAQIAVCLNITPDHLDRHHTMEAYARAKRRLFETQAAADYAVLNYDDPVCRSFGDYTAGQVCWFGTQRQFDRGAWLEEDRIVLQGGTLLRRQELPLRGMHNVENVMAAALAAQLAGAKTQAIAAAVKTFPGVPHRIEFVRRLHGVEYFNDSKATNVDATLKAVAAFEQPLWLILGGKDKGGSYQPLIDPLRQKARAVLVIGAEEPAQTAARPRIRAALSDSLPVVDCGTLSAAVRYAKEHAADGDVVLLAPACASFDQFRDYEQRGDSFKELVRGLG